MRQLLPLPARLDKITVQNCVLALTVSEMNTYVRYVWKLGPF